MEQDIGYLKATVQEIKEDLKEMKKEFRQTLFDDRLEFKRVMQAHIKDEEERLKRIEDQLSLGKHFMLFLKALGMTVIFLFAFKFGDISSLWKGWWNG